MSSAEMPPARGHSAGTNRRMFIKRAGIAAAGMTVPGLLEACGSTTPGGGGASSTSGGSTSAASTTGAGPGGLPLARPNRPLKLPIYADNKPIASGMKPEAGPLEFYNWIAYINPAVVKDFEKKYNVKVNISTFDTIDEAVAKLSSGAVQFDVFVPEVVFLERLVVGKILQPLNLSYIPNLHANAWPSLHSPWYDVGAQYTVPYTIYTTGLGWRNDKLPNFNPENYANPWSALWLEGPKISGRVGMLDDEHDAMTMALLHEGVTNSDTENAKQLSAASSAIKQLVNTTNLKFDTNEYQHLAAGDLWLHQAWSGDMAAAPSYAPKGTPPSVFSYWWPKDGRGPINNDTFAVLKGAKNPVLAHLFLNHILDVQQVFLNFTYNFYQQPINAMTPESLTSKGLLPKNLDTTIIREAQFKQGYVQAPLSQNGETLWQSAWAAARS